MSLLLQITDAGRQALINAKNTGTLPITIDKIAVGTGLYTPNPEQTELLEEVKQLETFAGDMVAADTIHVTIRDESSDAYSLGEFGLITDDGVLFAVYSQDEVILDKSSAGMLVLAVDVKLVAIDAAHIEFGGTGFMLPPGTSGTAGVLQLADTDESKAGENIEKALTPGGCTLHFNERTTEVSRSLLKREDKEGLLDELEVLKKGTDSGETRTNAENDTRFLSKPGTIPASRIDETGVLEITPADGRYITLDWSGTDDIEITGFGDKCPVGYSIVLTIPRTTGNTGGPVNVLGNYAQFIHTAGFDGLDMELNLRMDSDSALYTYQAYPNATGSDGNRLALYEQLEFVCISNADGGRWKLTKLPDDFVAFYHNPRAFAKRQANGLLAASVQQAVAIDSLPATTTIDIPVVGAGTVEHVSITSMGWRGNDAVNGRAVTSQVISHSGQTTFYDYALRGYVEIRTEEMYSAGGNAINSLRHELAVITRWKPSV